MNRWPPLRIPEWIAAFGVLVAAVAHGLMRVRCTDINSHLATARWAYEHGFWPVVNTFSYTHADFPLYCQYAGFEALSYLVHRLAGWEGLSALVCVGWLAVLLLFVRWSGSWRHGAALHLAWLIALMALQRRIMPRPELLSMFFLASSLIVIDGYLKGRTRLAALLPLIHLAWVNSHQLFPISLAVQSLLVVHLLLSRWGKLGVDRAHARLPLWPAAAALLGSMALTFATPLGVDVLQVPLWTADTLRSHRHHVQEFGYIWSYPLELQLALLCALPAAIALWVCRRRWWPFEVGLWLMSLLLVLSTMRGIVFFSVISIGLFARVVARHPPSAALRARVRPAIARLVRLTLAAVTLGLVTNIVYHRWIAPPLLLGGTHPGIGRTRGDWPDAAIAALRSAPPPGRMMNMPWSLASPLIWFAPELPTFVDARFETFPRQFLVDAANSYGDHALLARLIHEHRPGWIVAEHCETNIRARLARLVRDGPWVPTYVDARVLVLVRDDASARAYIAEHRLARYPEHPRDLLRDQRGLRAQQRTCYGLLLRALGREAQAARELQRAQNEARGDGAALGQIAKLLAGD